MLNFLTLIYKRGFLAGFWTLSSWVPWIFKLKCRKNTPSANLERLFAYLAYRFFFRNASIYPCFSDTGGLVKLPRFNLLLPPNAQTASLLPKLWRYLESNLKLKGGGDLMEFVSQTLMSKFWYLNLIVIGSFSPLELVLLLINNDNTYKLQINSCLLTMTSRWPPLPSVTVKMRNSAIFCTDFKTSNAGSYEVI